MATDLTTTTPAEIQPPAPSEKRLTVFARNPQEMKTAQASLVAWCAGKLAEIREEAEDLRANHETAVSAGWSTIKIARQLSRTRKRVEFYEKVHAALQAGYCIVPGFPIDVFAIRTTKIEPKANLQRNTSTWRAPTLRQQESESPPAGEGEFMSATPAGLQRMVLDEAGKHVGFKAWATAFRDVDFPFALAEPAILEATRQAMVDRVFDELGVSPARQRPRGDPMVIGRIYAPAPHWQRQEKSLSFVVAWFLRPERDLDF